MHKVARLIVVLAFMWAAVSAQVGFQCSSKIFLDLVKPLGYPVEEHEVTTSDNYVLKVFRIQAKNSEMTNGKPVIILNHGNEDSSDNFVLNDEDKALGFFLANQGYDVWLPNNRGNKYSMTNTKISRYLKAFWDFSFQEMGAKDAPAVLDYALKVSGTEKAVYVGHSQGSTQMFAGLSDPDSTEYLNSKLSKYIALAPVVYTTQCHNKALNQFANNPLILQTCDLWGQWDIFPNSCSTGSGQSAFMSYLCTIAPDMCKQFLSGGDLDPVYDNTKKLNIFFAHSPNGASVRCFQHFAQMFYEPKADPKFRKFDFGKYTNQKVYGQDVPPVYDFNNIKIPVAVFAGLQDTLADPGDTAILNNNLRKAGVKLNSYQYNQWGHMTFVWGLNVEDFFTDILREIKEVETFTATE